MSCYLSSSVGRDTRLIHWSEVAFFRASDKYVDAHLADSAGTYLLDQSLAEIERRFPSRFVRIHRSLLVARDRIQGFVSLPGSGASKGLRKRSRVVVRLRGIDERLVVSVRCLAKAREACPGASMLHLERP